MNASELTLLFDRSTQQGRLELTGRDRFDLLQRMSTNDFGNIQPGEGRTTVLTTAIARIIDQLIVYHRGESAVMIDNYPDVVRAWLQRHIFFRDQVKLRDVSAELGQLELHGAQATAIVEQFAVGSSVLAADHFVEAMFEAAKILIAPTFPLRDHGYILLAPISLIDTLQKRVMQTGNVIAGNAHQYEQLRISAGLPGADHELTEDYIPLEANLWESVSFTKGCYIGQEIIARMESRNRLAKTLVRLRLSGPAAIGIALSDGQKNVGTLTSVAALEEGTIAALAFVKTDWAEPGTQLHLIGEDQTALTAEIMTVPSIQVKR